MWMKLVGISGHVNCQVPFDKIRAIFPMVWNAPTSTHAELCALVGKVLERVEQMQHMHCKARVKAAPSNEISCSEPEQLIVAQGRLTGYQGINGQSSWEAGDINAEAVGSTQQSVTEPGSLVGQATNSGRGTDGGQGACQPLPEGAEGDLIELMRQMVEDHRKAGCSSDE